MNKLIEDFCIAFATDIESWKHWKEEVKASDKIIIAGPSRIVGLIDLKKMGKIEWESYSIISFPTNKMKGNFVYNGGMYSMDFLKKIMQFLPDPLEIARVNEAILFKLTESVAMGLGEKKTSDEFYYNDEGILFEDLDFEETKEEWRTVQVAKEFIKWENNLARWKHTGKGTTWYEEVYRFEKFFEEELEDMGDMMML